MLTLEASGHTIVGVGVVLTRDIALEGLLLLSGERATIVRRNDGGLGVTLRMHDHHCELKPWGNCCVVADDDENYLHAWEPSHGVDVLPPLNERWGGFIHRAWTHHPAIMLVILTIIGYAVLDTVSASVPDLVTLLKTTVAYAGAEIDSYALK
jgi:hypothetical protein